MTPHESKSPFIADLQEEPTVTGDPYAIRAQFLKHEKSIKMIARLNILGGALFTAVGVLGIVALLGGGGRSEPDPLLLGGRGTSQPDILFVFFLMLAGTAGLWLGIALNQLKGWARVVMSVLYVPNLIIIPIGTIISGVFIWTLLHKKARFICSEEYKAIIAATPDIKRYMRGGRKPPKADSNDRRRFIERAKQCVSYSMNQDSLCPLDDFARESLGQLYGQAWLQDNEEFLRAMLTFVDEYNLLTDRELLEFAEADAAENCLLNIFNGMRLTGAFDQPTIPKGKPDFADFALAFSGGDIVAAFSDPKSPSFILTLSVKVASEFADRKAA